MICLFHTCVFYFGQHWHQKCQQRVALLYALCHDIGRLLIEMEPLKPINSFRVWWNLSPNTKFHFFIGKKSWKNHLTILSSTVWIH